MSKSRPLSSSLPDFRPEPGRGCERDACELALASRRGFLAGAGALTAGAALSSLLPVFDVHAAPLTYRIEPVKVRDDVWVIFGAQEAITRENGGAIANIGIIDTSEGAVVIDTGPSKRYGEALNELARELTGKPVVRAYLTHFHPDHVFGSQAFGKTALASAEGVRDGLKLIGEDFSSAMYYTVGDWMRGTELVLPQVLVSDQTETIGDKTFTHAIRAGHTDCDLMIREEKTGVVFAGDLVFLNRAATTPHADIATWYKSLDEIEAAFSDRNTLLVPGHGPVSPSGQGVRQTRRWLEMVEAKVNDCFERGLTITEAIAEPLPDWTGSIALARYEWERSVLHLYAKLEAGNLPRVDKS